jgi:subtilase family serine protease
MRTALARWSPIVGTAAAAAVLWLVLSLATGQTTAHGAGTAPLPVLQPRVGDFAQMTHSETPPSQAQCASAGRRCFDPYSTRAAYNANPLYAAGRDGRGRTIAVVDSYGSDTMAHDLHVYDTTWNLPRMCGEEGVTCTPGMPRFSELALQGSPATKAPPSKSNGTGQEDKSAWALEVALDVETAHAMAPGANILLVHTPTAETLGVQGLPQMMAAEKYVVDHHLADVISQSFGTAEEAFGSSRSLENLRDAFKAAAADHVTVLASSGDGGSANDRKTPVGKGGSTIPFPTVSWPASDPLVTGIGGTYLCTDPNNRTTRTLDNVSPPVNCQGQSQLEIGWIDAGGGFSHVFARPAFQSTLPPGSTPIPASQRGVPDVALQASSRTGALVYLTLPPDGDSGLICPDGNPCSTGWYDIGGTSLSTPEWAGLVAIAAQIHGGGLGQINPALYRLAANPATYAADFYDVTVGNNQADPSIQGFSNSPGWDPVTGLGTPNAANLVPALAANAG